MDFYLYLPSNTGDFVDNTLGRFKVKLPNKVDLDGDWEVALVEMAYPVTWFSISNEEEGLIALSYAESGEYRQKSIPFNNYTSIDGLCDAINYTLDHMKSFKGDRANFYFKYDHVRHRVVLKPESKTSISNVEFITLSPKIKYMLGFKNVELSFRYEKMEVLFANREKFVSKTIDLYELNESIRNGKQVFEVLSELLREVTDNGENARCRFRYVPSKEEVVLESSENDTVPNIKYIKFSDIVQSKLGLSDNIMYPNVRNKVSRANDFNIIGYYMTAEEAPDVRGSRYALFVYCDVVHPQIIGNTLAPILRAVSIKGNYGDITDQLYDNPHYVPVLKRDFDTIEINISDDTGKAVNFQYGKLFVKLHFRMKQ